MSMRYVAWPLAVVALLSLVGCSSNAAVSPEPSEPRAAATQRPTEAVAGDDGSQLGAAAGTYRIVTLGDSYTHGTGTDIPGRDSWPAQLTTVLRQRTGMRVRLFNLARDSSTTDEVLEEQLREVAGHEPDVVTLQVGLNDIVSDSAEWSDWYGSNIALIFDELEGIVDADHIFAITTPDHTLTEWGRAYGDHETVRALNAILREEAERRGIAVIDIGPVNERVTVDADLLVTADQPKPYPTAKQYAGWAETIGHHVYGALMSAEP